VRRGAALAAALLVAAPAAGFEDPLDVPARRSALAARAPLAGVARAGARLVAVGQRGHVLVSDDGGRSFRQVDAPVSVDLTAVRFVSSARGFAVGHDGVVLATDDGGETWAVRLDGRRLAALLAAEAARAEGGAESRETLAALRAQGAGLALLDVAFADASTGLAVGAFGLVVRTDDGGATWRPWLHADNPDGLHLHAIARAGGALLAVGERGLVLRLDREGRRLRAAGTPWRGSLFGIVDRGGAAVAFGLRGRAFVSRDGGARWAPLESGTDATLTSGAALPDGRVALGTAAGELLLLRDGAPPLRVAGARRVPIAGIAAAEPGAIVAVGAGGAARELLP
jgi:photosystem II stability/assembly factor-like uncharacterized protein